MPKLLPDLKSFEYKVKCKCLRLQTLDKKRGRGDLIKTYKILNGSEDVDYKIFF